MRFKKGDIVIAKCGITFYMGKKLNEDELDYSITDTVMLQIIPVSAKNVSINIVPLDYLIPNSKIISVKNTDFDYVINHNTIETLLKPSEDLLKAYNTNITGIVM